MNWRRSSRRFVINLRVLFVYMIITRMQGGDGAHHMSYTVCIRVRCDTHTSVSPSLLIHIRRVHSPTLSHPRQRFSLARKRENSDSHTHTHIHHQRACSFFLSLEHLLHNTHTHTYAHTVSLPHPHFHLTHIHTYIHIHTYLMVHDAMLFFSFFLSRSRTQIDHA